MRLLQPDEWTFMKERFWDPLRKDKPTVGQGFVNNGVERVSFRNSFRRAACLPYFFFFTLPAFSSRSTSSRNSEISWNERYTDAKRT